MPEPRVPLQPDHYYHIFNHAVGDDLFFKNDRDYIAFLRRVDEYILPVTTVLSFCELPNHFHLVVKLKPRAEILSYLTFKLGHFRTARLSQNEFFIEDQLSRIYSNAFSAYAKHYNVLYDRMGTLFKRAFMRKPIETNEYLFKVINYVHMNPVEHEFVLNPEDWRFSSYNSIIHDRPSIVNRAEVLDLYGGLENFLALHQKVVTL